MTAMNEKLTNWAPKLWVGTVIGLCMLGAVGRAEEATQTLTTQAAVEKSKILASIDIRPSWITKSGSLTTENSVSLGVKFNPTLTINYLQGFNSNLYNPANSETESGLNPTLDFGALQTKVSNLWKNEANGLSLAYESRVYFPTDQSSQNKGMIVAARNYLKLSKKISDTVKMTLSEVLIPIANSKAGTLSDTGAASANKVFENRVYLVTDFQITSKLSLSVPIMFHQSRYANFRADAKNNSGWDFFVWVYPEVEYAVTDNYTVGVAYYNNSSLFTPDLKKANFGAGLESGEFQLVFTASL